ncbi:PLP-dependent aspartate aminotransferase family protein [Micromonospora sp. NPDC051296]|uniref:trans-sulfuration enzyme family protein n=1 Tax=Micromonospora sp. NPDC051296 TaxID=3155046 RepID=UPI00343EBFBC
MRFDTRLVHGGRRATPGTGDVVPPIHVSTTYERRAQDDPRYFYGRGENPTREELEECLAGLEGAEFATVLSSGQAAAATVLSLLRPGQCVVSTDDVYSGTDALFDLAARQGIQVRYADLTTPEGIDAALDEPDVALVWVETPTNPLLTVVDVAEVAGRTHERGARLVLDNTFASPVLQQPLALGADISLYSTTKSIAGHADVLGGALVYRDEDLHASFRSYRTAAGNVPGALDCFLVRRGLHTLSLRVHRQVGNARALVERLRSSPAVGAIHYPGLPEHPQHAVAKAQMAASGSMVSFDYLGGPAEQLLDRFALFSCGVSLGGVHSLVECPALMTHRPVPADVRARRGIGDSLIRLSAGIEDVHDLVEDLSRALADGT